MVKVFYHSNAAMEDWHSIELPDVCPYHIRQMIESCSNIDPTKVIEMLLLCKLACALIKLGLATNNSRNCGCVIKRVENSKC